MNRSITTAFFILFSFLLAACSAKRQNTESDSNQTDTSEVASKSNLGEAPDFQKITMSGEEISLSDYRGKVVLLNFWATWCAPCRREIPALIELQDDLGDEGLVIIGISLDEEGFEKVRPFAEEFEINYPIVMDDYSYGDKLGGIYLAPTTFIIDQQGMIAARKIGEITIDNIRPTIEKLLGI